MSSQVLPLLYRVYPESLNGIGYSGIGYKTASVRTVPLAKKPGDAFVDALQLLQ